MSKLPQDILNSIVATVGGAVKALHEPQFDDIELEYMRECLSSTYVSSVGEFIPKFESQLADYVGAKFAIAVVNGTSALHAALLASGIRPGDEVLMPSLTFVATANAISYCSAIPHFIDSSENTLGIDVSKLRGYLEESTILRNSECINKKTGRVIKAIIPMHTFGHISSMEELISISQEFKLELIEDAAEALGSFYKGRHAGTFGRCGVFSFNGNKIITTGGGGAIVTNDEMLAIKIRHITTTAKLPHSWNFYHDQLGFNYRMPNINAALGCAQLLKIRAHVENKRRLYQIYEKNFASVKGVRLFKEPDNSMSNYWLQTLVLDREFASLQPSILEHVNNAGIAMRPVWKLMHELPMYRESPSASLLVAKSLESRLLNIPSSAFLGRIYE